ncbi:MAG: T9SS type A sorting domain-containing protein [Flavobacteriales bacterium]|nr:T9SS type A sorting domain-containing protein [Flavobacteriales bacterium]
MKQLYTALAALCLSLTSQAQLNVLYVVDTDIDSAGNANLTTALTNSGHNFTTFDAATMVASPTFATDMSGIDLVIWYTGSNGVDLQLWGGMDTINQELYQYLNSGGALWVIGNDFLYDLYDAPPVYFNSTDQAAVLFGIDSYDVQSYGNDSNEGVPQMDLASGHTITDQTPLTFVWSTLWWGDGGTPAAGTQVVYEMGPGTYTLSGYPSATYFDNGTYQVLAYYFNAAMLNTQGAVDEAVKDVLDYFQTVGIKEEASKIRFHAYPNPVRDQLTITWESQTHVQQIRLIDNTGRLVIDKTCSPGTVSQTLDMSALPAGVYHVSVSDTDGNQSGHHIVR